MSIFEDDFNIEKYAEQRLMEVKDLPTRSMLRSAYSRMFRELFRETSQRLLDLEERVLGEIPIFDRGPVLYTTLVFRDEYDKTDEFMHPMMERDLSPISVDLKAVAKQLAAGEPYYLESVYFEAEHSLIAKLTDEEKVFEGILETNHGIFAAKFSLTRDYSYEKMIEGLYPFFIDNFFVWRTACAPYVRRFFKVSLIEVENLDPEDEYKAFDVILDNYEPYVKWNVVPLWNISEGSVVTSLYPEPCIDAINYEHRLFSHHLPIDTKFLVVPPETVFIDKICWLPNKNGSKLAPDLLVTTTEPDPVEWKLLIFNNFDPDRHYSNPLMSNNMRDTFADRLQGQCQPRLRTYTEIFRVLKGVEVALDWLEAVNVEIIPNNFTKENYRPDEFILEEIRTGDWPLAMKITFKRLKSPSYLDEDVMSYLAGVMQNYYPEYECCGHLEE